MEGISVLESAVLAPNRSHPSFLQFFFFSFFFLLFFFIIFLYYFSLLFIIYYLLFIIYYLLFIIYYLLFIIYYLLFIILFIIYCLPFSHLFQVLNQFILKIFTVTRNLFGTRKEKCSCCCSKRRPLFFCFASC